MDRINHLPDEILCQILAFLPTTKEAAKTSLLSKRWRNLFALSPSLYFQGKDILEGEVTTSFIDFVDRVLAVSGNSTVRKLSLTIRRDVESPHINGWMINALSRGIVDLKLHHITTNVTTLPLEVFTCKTLVKLHLLGSAISLTMVPQNASLPALKTLFLDIIRFSGFAFEALLSACHVLEQLRLVYYPWGWIQGQNVTSCSTLVSCRTLKWLHLRCMIYELGVSRSVSFDTPRLAYLYYSDCVVDEYPIVNLESLVEAEISLESRYEGNPEKLIKGLRNVKILNLSFLEISKVLYSFREAIPQFKHLSRLSVMAVFPSVGWKLIPVLLKKSPKLKTLVIQGPGLYYHKYENREESQSLICECLSECSFLSSCLVKVLEITQYMGTKGELKQMKLFLEKLQCLETVNVRAGCDAKVTSKTDMLMLPRASKIQFKFFPYEPEK